MSNNNVRDDAWWEQRWRELGYDAQERAYYAAAPLERSAPQSSHGLARFVKGARSGIRIIAQGGEDVRKSSD